MIDSALVLLSGGLDSAYALTVAAREAKRVLTLTVLYGQASEQRELAAAKKLSVCYGATHESIAMPFMGGVQGHPFFDAGASMPEPTALDDAKITKASADAVWVPNRNGVFLNVAAAIAEARGASAVYVGFNREEAATFPDNSIAFVEATNAALAFSTRESVRIEAPAATLDKTAIVAELVLLGFDFSLLWSCYRGGETMCGLCESCRRLKRALTSVLTINQQELFLS